MRPPPDADAKSLSRDRFGRFAGAYVHSPSHATGADLDLLLEIAAPQPDWTVLDVGTGGGHTARLIAPHVRRVVATDLTPAMLSAAEAHLKERGATNVDYAVADAEDLTFGPDSFQLVTCRNAAHHFPRPARFLKEAVRVLQPGGRLVVQDQTVPDDPEAARFINDFERRRDPSHVRALPGSEWQRLFTEVGLSVDRIEHVTKIQDLATWAGIQDCDDETVAHLAESLRSAPGVARTWMRPRLIGGRMTFSIQQILISGRTGD